MNETRKTSKHQMPSDDEVIKHFYIIVEISNFKNITFNSNRLLLKCRSWNVGISNDKSSILMSTVCFDLLFVAIFSYWVFYHLITEQWFTRWNYNQMCIVNREKRKKKRKKRPSDDQQQNKRTKRSHSLAVNCHSPFQNRCKLWIKHIIHYCLIALPCIVTNRI